MVTMQSSTAIESNSLLFSNMYHTVDYASSLGKKNTHTHNQLIYQYTKYDKVNESAEISDAKYFVLRFLFFFSWPLFSHKKATRPQ